MNDQKNKQQQPQGSDKDQNKSGQQQGGQGASGGAQQNSASQPKGSMADTHRQQPMGSEIENPDQDNDPDRKVDINDDPEQTKKKVPNMHK